MRETCKGIKLDGGPCGQVNVGPSGYCHRHKAQIPDEIVVDEVEAPQEFAPAPTEAPIVDLTAPVKVGSPEDRARTAAKRRKDKRAERLALGGHAGQRMLAHTRPGYKRRWCNDSGARIEEMLDKGWDFVFTKDASINNDDLGTRKSLQVSKHGPPVTAYLMELPEKDYLDGQQDKERRIQQTENQIRSASTGIGSERDSSGQSVAYNPARNGNHLLD